MKAAKDASAIPWEPPERDKRGCGIDMLLMLEVEANILPRLAVWSILFCPAVRRSCENPRPERRFVTKSLISTLKRPGTDLNNH